MKKFIWLAGSFSAAAAYMLITRSKPSRTEVPVQDLALKLQAAWADHHTVV